MNNYPKKTPIKEQEPLVRNKNFEEVSFGYTEQEAKNEAARCLQCKHRPCMSGCPVSVQIPEFIALVAAGDFEGAYQKITETNSLPAVCGRVCPQEKQCESKCVRGIKGEPVAIGRLERFVADYHRLHSQNAENAKKTAQKDRVAIIGSGPAGLACAGDLNAMGYDVTVFEALHIPGGVLSYGIPEFRLPKAIVADEINNLQAKGVKFEMDTVVGRTTTVDKLFEDGFKAVFIGSGAGLPSFMGIEGEGLNGVYSANEFLTRVNLMKAYRDDYETPIRKHNKIAVVGGGNVAMDAARCAKRLGAEKVYIVNRRGEEELPARKEEVHHAKEEEIEFHLLVNPVKIIGDEKGNVTGIECVKMELGKPDESGRRTPVTIEGSNFILDVDAVIMAIGTSPNPLLKKTTKGLETNKRGCLVVEESDDGQAGVQTTREGVFAGGDAVTGAATVILAMGAGKKAAAAIDEYIKSK